MPKINWKNQVVKKNLYFTDLQINETFRNAGNLSRGAVYRKVRLNRNNDFFMLEEATGLLFDATSSIVERVDVEINIAATQPEIYL